MFAILFIVDIVSRSIVEEGYFLRFFFLVDVFSLVIIFASIIVTDVAFYIVLSFLKTIMIVRITQIVVSYRKFARKKLVEKVMKQKEAQAEKERAKSNKGFADLVGKNKSASKDNSRETLKSNVISAPSPGNVSKTSKKSFNFKTEERQSKVIAFSKTMVEEANEELEEMFKKQTKLESHVTVLTIKRTMT